MRVVVDTNVPLVANRRAEQASQQCILACTQRIRDIAAGRNVLVLDDGWHILREYQNRLRSDGQPGPGDAFLKWVLTNRANPQRCEIVHITPVDDDRRYLEFPSDPDLDGFHQDDRKFVAVAIAHQEHPPVLNAVDSDWWEYRRALSNHGVRVDFVCSDAPFMK